MAWNKIFSNPSRPSHSEVKVIVTIEQPGQDVMLRTWRGSSVAAIKRAARAKYGPKARLQYGAPMWEHSWGAH